MTTLSPEARAEFVRHSREVYEQQILPLLDPRDTGKFVVLDPDSGDYEVDARDIAAIDRLRLRRPDALFYIARAGYPTAYRLGHRR